MLETPNDWFNENPEEILIRIYAANYNWLENYIRQNSGYAEDAKDIFQESIAVAWLNLREGRFTGNRQQFTAYLRQVCKYKWLNQLKSAPHSKMQYKENWSHTEQADNSHEVLEQQLEQSARLKHCFAQLGDKCREVLGLFYYHRQSLSEIANTMNNTEESIKTIKYRCMMQLRKLYLEQNKGKDE